MTDIRTDANLALFKTALEKQPLNIKRIIVARVRNTPMNVDYDDLNSEAFADKDRRMFPIFSPGNAIMSALHMQRQKGVDDSTKERCKKSLIAFKLRQIADLLDEQSDEEETPILKIAEECSDVEFLLPSKRKLPVANKDMLKKSASILESNFHSLTQEEKIEGAGQLMKISKEYGMDINSNDIKVYGLDMDCDLIKVAMAITDRMMVSGDKDSYQPLYDNITSYSNSNGRIVKNEDMIYKIASNIIDLDKKNGISSEFDTIKDVYNTNKEPMIEKKAEDEYVNISDEYIQSKKIIDMTESDINHLFGETQNFESDNDKIEKVANFVEGLPVIARSHALDIIKK